MRKNILTTKFIKMSFAGCCLALSTLGMSQNTGDFKSVQSGDWSSPSTWNVYDGAIWNTTTSFPSATSESDAPAVYLENTHEISLSGDNSCGDIHVNTETSSEARLDVNDNELFVWGKMRLYSGSLPGTDNNAATSAIGFIRTGIDGYITFKGSESRSIVDNGEYDASGSLKGWNMKVDFTAGDTAYINSNMRVSNLIITSGHAAVTGGFSFRPSGATDNLADNTAGWIKIKSGTSFTAPQLHKSGSKGFDSLVVDNGGTLIFDNSSTVILACKELFINGTIVVKTVSFPDTDGKSDAVLLTDIYNLEFDVPSVSSVSIPGDLNILNKLIRNNNAIDNNGFNITFEADASVEYAGSEDMTTGSELTNATKIIMNTTGHVNLSADFELSNELKLTSGLLHLGDNNLTLGENATVSGDPSNSSMVVTTGDGEMRKVFTSTGSFTFNIGDTTNFVTHSPIQATVNSGTLTSSTYVGTQVTNSAHPVAASQANVLNKHWSLTTDITSLDLSGVGFYDVSEISGDESVLATYLFEDNTITSTTTELSSLDNSLKKVTYSGVTSSIFISAFEGTSTNVEDLLNSSIIVGPNPTNDKVNISTTTGQLTGIDIINACGISNTLISGTSTSELTIDVDLLSSGIYVLLIHTTEGSIKKKITVL